MGDTCKWKDEQEAHQTKATKMQDVFEILEKAKVNNVSQLKGIPVEVTLDGNRFKSFRILEEVI